jgi:hypothetical protein
MDFVELLVIRFRGQPTSPRRPVASPSNSSSSSVARPTVFKSTILAVALGLCLPLALSVAGPTPHANAVALPPVPTVPVGPPTYTVNVNKASGDHGDVFYTTGPSATAVGLSIPPVDTALANVQPPSLVIATKARKIIWRHDAPKGELVADFRAQVYRGHQVLTWRQGSDEGGHGAGADYIANTHYKIIKKVTLPAPYNADVHEFRITPNGRALITCYNLITHDMSSIGGPKSAQMNDALAFVVNMKTGKVLDKWDALTHIPLTNTRARIPLPGQTSYDPYHINSISLDAHKNLVISFRNLSAIYDVNIHTGHIKWVLGGAHPTLKAGPGIEFAFQHDAEFVSSHKLQFFNDNAAGENDPSKPYDLVQGLSSVEQVKIDVADHTATLVHNWTHPDRLVAIAMGNAQKLPHGHTFVSWGTAPRISEFNAKGKLVYDASLPGPSYRAFLNRWPN